MQRKGYYVILEQAAIIRQTQYSDKKIRMMAGILGDVRTHDLRAGATRNLAHISQILSKV